MSRKPKEYPELDDREMTELLNEARTLYEDGAVWEAMQIAERFAKRIRRWAAAVERFERGEADA